MGRRPGAADGVITGIVGPNGAGKSTLLKGVLDLVPRVSGSVAIYGKGSGGGWWPTFRSGRASIGTIR